MSILKKAAVAVRDILFLNLILVAKIAEKIPKDKKIWVFGCWGGKQYSDNSKYEFEYVNKTDKNIRAIWITRKNEVLEEVCSKGYEAYKAHSLKGMWYCVRAGAAFLTEDRHDISRVLISGATIIQLWHGMGIKDITTFFPKNESRARKAYTDAVHSHTSEYWMTACDDAIEKYGSAFKLSKDRMFITGQPKDDMFIVNTRNGFIDKLRKKHPDCKIVGYLPTHRNFGNHSKQDMLSYKTLKKVNEHLREHNIIMIFKPHIHELNNYNKTQAESLSNIVFAFDPKVFGDVYQYLPACDAMITDYSGIMLGYLTGEKPVLYFAYDYEDYISDDAGFYFKYSDVVAGPVCKTWDETVDALDEIFRNDTYAEDRRIKRERFSPYNDGKNRERVYKKVKSILK